MALARWSVGSARGQVDLDRGGMAVLGVGLARATWAASYISAHEFLKAICLQGVLAQTSQQVADRHPGLLTLRVARQIAIISVGSPRSSSGTLRRRRPARRRFRRMRCSTRRTGARRSRATWRFWGPRRCSPGHRGRRCSMTRSSTRSAEEEKRNGRSEDIVDHVGLALF
jgi:hypothetical protein